MRFVTQIFSVFCLALVMVSSPVQAASSDWVRSGTVEGRLVTASDSTNGDMIAAGVELKMDKGWHVYWRTPGDAGLAPDFDWSGSTNLADTKVFWPAPKRYNAFGIDNFVYETRVLFPIDITPKTDGAVDLNLDLDLLACADICVPENIKLSLSLPQGTPDLSKEADLIVEAKKILPQENPAFGYDIYDTELVQDEDSVFLATRVLTDKKPAKLDLFIETAQQHAFGKPEYRYNAQQQELLITALYTGTMESFESLAQEIAETPVTLTLVTKQGAVETRVTPQMVAGNIDTGSDTELPSLLYILAVAVLGGLILNLMPCVLPVLSLKVLSVLSHGGRVDVHTRYGFLSSAAGIIASFWVIAGGLIALKSAGQAIGWGIQFQSPVFLSFLIIVVLGFALNLFGLFELRLPSFITQRMPKTQEKEATMTGHFLTGALATLLATPCTAPFLGTAVGFALSQGPFEILSVFTALGIGLALPYLVFALFPQLMKFLPKPGKWMLTLKKILGVALLLTALWLASILMATSGATVKTEAAWNTFDESRIQSYVDAGQTVFVDVTADWCLTCKANKKFVLDTDTVKRALYQDHVVLMVADWTERDDRIATYLKEYGRFGIPFNIVYGPEAPEGIILPELLTEKRVLDALKQSQRGVPQQ